MNNPLAFIEPAWLWLLIPALLLPFALRRGGRFWQGAALTALVLAAAGPVVSGLPRPAPIVTCRAADGVSPAQAAARAGASIRSDAGGVVRLTGVPGADAGELNHVAVNLAQRGIPLELARGDAPDAVKVHFRDFRYPLLAGCGETVQLEAVADAPHASTGQLEVRSADGRRHSVRTLTLRAGANPVKVPLMFPAAGDYTLSLFWEGREAARLPIQVAPPYRALLFTRQPEEEAAVKRMLAGRAIPERYRDGMKMADYPVLIFGAQTLDALPAAAQREAAEAVTKHGAGMMVFTGRALPGASGTLTPELEAILPCRYDGKNRNRIPTVSLIVILDTSGSMAGTRIALAREVARLAIDQLRDCDLAGIVEFHGKRRWAAPLQSAANHLELRRALNRLSAGGGTVILPALREAFFALRNADTRLKHVLIITDGGVEQGDFEGLLREMARYDITTSTVMAGTGQSEFLAQLALWGNGQSYNAASRFALPELTFRQSGKEALPPYKEGDFALERVENEPLSAECPDDLRVTGVLENECKEDARELLRAGGQPFAAFRASGDGGVAVFHTEFGGANPTRAAASPAFTGWLSAMLRQLPEPARRHPYKVVNRTLGSHIHLEIETRLPLTRLYAELDGRRYHLTPESDGAFHLRTGLPADGIHTVKLSAEADFSHAEVLAVTNGNPVPDGWNENSTRIAAELNRRARMLPQPVETEGILKLRGMFGMAAIVFLLAGLLARRWPRRGAAAVVLLFACLGGQSGFAAELPQRTEIREALLSGNRLRAQALFRDAIAASGDAAMLCDLADAAGEAALYPEALSALRKARELPGIDRWQVRFREYEMLRLSGAPDQGLALLRADARADGIPPGVRLRLADVAEQMGDGATALALYRRIPGEEAMLRAAMQLEERGEYGEAAALRLQLILTSGNEMRARQSMMRLIALADKRKQLPALATETAERLRQNPSPRLELFYERILAAAGRHEELLARLTGSREKEKRRLQFLLEFRRFQEAAALLDTMLAQYPEERAELLRQRAVVAIEKRDRALAAQTAAELLRTADDRAAALEYAAGMSALLGDHAAALRSYDEALRLAPDRIELHLLRANAAKAIGKSAEAIAFFERNLGDDVPADLFGVMVDGLLNLGAPPERLKPALAAVMRRIGRDPGMLFYYRLAEDLSEELGDAALWRKLQQMQLAVAPERRTLLLRNLFEDALQRDDRGEALRYAGQLLAADEIYAPELYQSIARCLAANGRFADAERCVRRADTAEKGIAHLFGFIEIAWETGHAVDAARICRELLSLRPDDPELLGCHAEILEFEGRYREAGMENLKALRRYAALLPDDRPSTRRPDSRKWRPLIRALATQTMAESAFFKPQLTACHDAARPAARKQIWAPLLERVAALENPPPPQPAKRPQPFSAARPAVPRRPAQGVEALVQLAQERHRAGRGENARQLAAAIFMKVEEQGEITLPLLRHLFALQSVYADAPEAREALIAAYRKPAGDPVRTQLAALLLHSADRHREAAELLFDLWRNGTRTLPVLMAMEDMASAAGMRRELAALLRVTAPKDAMVQALYSMRLVRLLREQNDDVRPYLASLPALLRKRETLLALQREGRREAFAAALKRYLLEQHRAAANPAIYADSFKPFFAVERNRPPAPRQNLLPGMIAACPELRDTLLYLLRGTVVNEPAYPILREAAGQ